jgi:hypothetical protein
VHCVDTQVILVTREFSNYKIREYKVTKEYRLRFVRAYPLYGHELVEGGRHHTNQNFIFLEATKDGNSYYLVYAPMLPSSNLLSHRFSLSPKQTPAFAQQIHPIANSSLLLLGRDTLMALTLPSLLFKFVKQNFQP